MPKKIEKAQKKPLEKVESERVKRTKIRVIGIGGGGSSIVSEIASRVKRASFLVANTDIKALRGASRKAIRFQFGENLTQGLGTGMDAELAEIAAQNEKERIKKILEGQDLLIVIACLGGGVGSGATPVFAKISKSLKNLTYGIFTLPFKFEGEKKMEIARNYLEKARGYFNAFSVLPNERIFQIIDKKTPLKSALSAINKSLAESLGGLIETIYQPGLINIDFADLKTILEGRGRLAYLNTVKVRKNANSAQEAIEKVLNNPLYPYSVRGAKGVLLNIAGERDLELSEVSQISKTIHDLLNKEAKIIFGISQGKQYSDIIKTTLLATGLSTKIFFKKRKPKKKKIIEKASLPEKKPQPPKPKTKTVKKAPKESPKGEQVPYGAGKFPTRQVKKAKSASRRIKIKVKKEAKESEISQPEVEKKKEEMKEIHRKNALQIKKEAEEAEQDLLEKEKLWETPAFLRRQNPEGK